MIASSLRRFTRDATKISCTRNLSHVNACEHATYILKTTHVAHLITLDRISTRTPLIATHQLPASRDHAIQEKQKASAHYIHTNTLILRSSPRLQQANPRARSSRRIRRRHTIQQAPKDAVKRNKHKHKRRNVTHASRRSRSRSKQRRG
jgi:hypothetical protein